MAKNQHSQQNLSKRAISILLLGTGGTIAGLTNSGGADQPAGYTAAQLGIEALLPKTQHPTHYQIQPEQLAQIDSKNMSFDVWERLYARLDAAMHDVSIDGVVMTHGTDTLEETAYFLYATLACTKPVVLTGAMRPFDAVDSDGGKNLSDALGAAMTAKAGVWIAFAGRLLPALGVQKNHPQNLDAFALRDIGSVPQPRFQLAMPIAHWPRVEIVMNYAGADGRIVQALMTEPIDGIVVAGTGNGTVSDALQAALDMACKAGIAVRLTTRCMEGRVLQNASHTFDVMALSPVQARLHLMLELLTHHSTTHTAAPESAAA